MPVSSRSLLAERDLDLFPCVEKWKFRAIVHCKLLVDDRMLVLHAGGRFKFDVAGLVQRECSSTFSRKGLTFGR